MPTPTTERRLAPGTIIRYGDGIAVVVDGGPRRTGMLCFNWIFMNKHKSEFRRLHPAFDRAACNWKTMERRIADGTLEVLYEPTEV